MVRTAAPEERWLNNQESGQKKNKKKKKNTNPTPPDQTKEERARHTGKKKLHTLTEGP